LGAILLVALALRGYLALSTAYIWDEDREWIPLGRSISFAEETRHLPWRSVSHPALSAYVLKATSTVLGDHALGYRAGFVIAGTIAILAVGLLAWQWLGFRGALAAAIVMTFNEYHLAVSMLATEKSGYLMCSAVALLFFGRFLKDERPRNLYVAAAASGVAFLFKETAGLLLPVFALALLVSGRAAWLGRPQTYVAAGIGALLLLPDLVWNLTNAGGGFGLHSGRVEGLGLTRYYLTFFGRDLVRDLYELIGRRLHDPVAEYPAMNAGWGVVLLVSAGLALMRWKHLPAIGRLAAVGFWFVLVWFTVIEPVQARRIEQTLLMLDTKVWFWVDLTLIPGALLAAWALTSLSVRWQRPAWGLLLALAVLSTGRVFHDRLGIPPVAVALAPNPIWPPAGQLVPVRAVARPCQICDDDLRLVRVRVDRFDGRGFVAPRPGEVAGATPGTDDREKCWQRWTPVPTGDCTCSSTRFRRWATESGWSQPA
jgi:4-amino-4-deoxy-L-arabinose transferase-like glycosyltransferase